MNSAELKRKFPNASPGFINANAVHVDRETANAKPERTVCDAPVREVEGKESHAKRVRVSIVAFRTRLLDPDNLCVKYFVDCLRYAGLIIDDRPEDIILEVSQVKVSTEDEERTEITLSSLN